MDIVFTKENDKIINNGPHIIASTQSFYHSTTVNRILVPYNAFPKEVQDKGKELNHNVKTKQDDVWHEAPLNQ